MHGAATWPEMKPRRTLNTLRRRLITEALTVARQMNAQQQPEAWSERRQGAVDALSAVVDALLANDATALRRLLNNQP